MVVNKCELSKWVIFQLSTKLKEQNYISVHEYIEAGGGGGSFNPFKSWYDLLNF